MTRTTSLVLSLTFALTLVVAQGRPTTEPSEAQPVLESSGVQFTAIDVHVDSSAQPLAAYQLEFTAIRGDVKLVGIEGGEHAAFASPPYYDPAALMNHRVILAAFNTGHDLPTGKSRVARLHVQISGDATPEYQIKLTVAASPDGGPVTATASVD